MADVFEINVSAISEHLKKIFSEGELMYLDSCLFSISVCPAYAVRTPNRKFWLGSVCMLVGSVFVCIIGDCREVRILFYLSMVWQYWSMDASGMGIRDVDMRLGRELMLSFGKLRLRGIVIEMKLDHVKILEGKR